MKMEYLITHCSDTPFNREVTPDDVWMWHLGPAIIPGNDKKVIYFGKEMLKTEVEKLSLTLPSGKIVNPIMLLGGRGWKQVGYADLIQRSGKLVNLVPYNFDDVIDASEITNGAVGYNAKSRSFVLAGGWTKEGNKTGKDKNGKLILPELLFTSEQIIKLKEYYHMQKEIVKTVKIIGHNECSLKTCPNFDVQLFLKNNNI